MYFFLVLSSLFVGFQSDRQAPERVVCYLVASSLVHLLFAKLSEEDFPVVNSSAGISSATLDSWPQQVYSVASPKVSE